MALPELPSCFWEGVTSVLLRWTRSISLITATGARATPICTASRSKAILVWAMGASPLPIQGLHHSCFKTPAKLLSTCPCASLRSSSAFRSRRSAYIQHTRVRERTYQHSAACAASSSFQPSKVVQLNEGCQEQHGGPPAAVRRALGFLAGSLAIAAWFKLSAGRPSSPFCSSTLTAPSHSGQSFSVPIAHSVSQ